MKKGVYLLPNGLTLCGMFFGFYSVISALQGDYVRAAWAILISNVFDGLDGWVARLTNSSTKFGLELDSLSDLVAFGVAPAVLVYTWTIEPFGRIGAATAFLYVACGALRLARYNIQMVSTEKLSFTGMPIPAAATVIATLVIFYHSVFDTPPEKSIPVLFLTIVLAILMISTLRFHGAKEFNMKKRKPFWMLVFFVVVIFVIVVHPPSALFFFAMTYLFWGIIENIYIYNKKRRSRKTS
ncbi:phosphatidylcholine synthase [bacterium BMS3Bbin06]|nr:phosphatidylcholine synthase [bacterium BMS3Abin08]GBE34107.1 phosphatidylcholine synthase [bacterium BMS3Bbin06]HDO36134.1 CDP-diacylglycerol--serine O-phosphatidyltransferase [Nitrospirota bacterium]HDY71098.1 CDP-diacylglycerol--serine O-phosphatidyltransferase [Nitrospirota bacterium]